MNIINGWGAGAPLVSPVAPKPGEDVTDWKTRAEAAEALADRLAGALRLSGERLAGIIEAYDKEREGWQVYLDFHGVEHSQEDCPHDDTCDCPEHSQIRIAWQRMEQEIEMAHRRRDQIKIALDEWRKARGGTESSIKPGVAINAKDGQPDQHRAEEAVLPDRDALVKALIRSLLPDGFFCTRVWEAWMVGTMTQDDFEPIDCDRVADEILEALRARGKDNA